MSFIFLLSYLKYSAKNQDLVSRSQFPNTIFVFIAIRKISLLVKNFTFDMESPHVWK